MYIYIYRAAAYPGLNHALVEDSGSHGRRGRAPIPHLVCPVVLH